MALDNSNDHEPQDFCVLPPLNDTHPGYALWVITSCCAPALLWLAFELWSCGIRVAVSINENGKMELLARDTVGDMYTLYETIERCIEQGGDGFSFGIHFRCLPKRAAVPSPAPTPTH